MKHISHTLAFMACCLFLPACSDDVDRLDVDFEKMKLLGNQRHYRDNMLDLYITERDMAMIHRRFCAQLQCINSRSSADDIAEKLRAIAKTEELDSKNSKRFSMRYWKSHPHMRTSASADDILSPFDEVESNVISYFHIQLEKEKKTLQNLLERLENEQYYDSEILKEAVSDIFTPTVLETFSSSMYSSWYSPW